MLLCVDPREYYDGKVYERLLPRARDQMSRTHFFSICQEFSLNSFLLHFTNQIFNLVCPFSTYADVEAWEIEGG